MRVHDSPVPTQTFFGSLGSMAMAPIDWVCSSKTGLKDEAAVGRLPDAAAGRADVDGERVRATASIAAMRPLMMAGPIERASSPPKVLESISTSAARATAAPASRPAAARQRIDLNLRRIHVSLED